LHKFNTQPSKFFNNPTEDFGDKNVIHFQKMKILELEELVAKMKIQTNEDKL